MGLSRQRHAALCFGTSFFIAIVSMWALEVDVLLKQNLPTRRVSGVESSGRREPEILFHVHVAKTAGSTLNRLIARRYYGVCGHKGYSFSQNSEDVVRPLNDAQFPGFGLDRVAPERMNEWGFHNCAFISHEIGAVGFKKAVQLNIFKNATKTGIFPCREPVEHLLSQCNFQGVNLTSLISNNYDCAELISRCSVEWNRYDDSLLDVFDRVILFKYDDFGPLIARLDETLPRRVITLPGDGYFKTNPPRDTQNERFGASCNISTMRQHLMRSWSYYTFCDTFLGEASYIELPRERVVHTDYSEASADVM